MFLFLVVISQFLIQQVLLLEMIKKSFLADMPFLGHWIKCGWGKYCKLSKLGKIPPIPSL